MDNFHYKLESEMHSFANSVYAKIDESYKFPLKVYDREQSPEIVDLSVVVVKNRVYPFIRYKSSIVASDSVKLDKENIDIDKVLNSILPGSKEIGDSCVYQVLNEYPSRHAVPIHTFIRKN